MQSSLEPFHYQIFGDNSLPKCVFLHGILGQGKNWRSFARRFSTKFQCLIYDQRGHGQSFQPDSGYGLKNFADDLRQILRGLGWDEPIHLLGHSMGGRVALQFTQDYPELLQKLVIVDIGPVSDWESMQAILDKIDHVPVPFASSEEAKAFFAGPFQERYPGKMLADFFYSNIGESSPGKWGWIFAKHGVKEALETSRWADYWSYFHNLKLPTLLIRGAKSTDLRQEDFSRVIANNPHILGEVIAGAGHWVHAEQPVETLRVLENFFEMDGDAH